MPSLSRSQTAWNAFADALKEIAIRDLEQLGLIHRESVGHARIHRISHAYPCYDLSYKANLDSSLEYLDTFENLKTAGRQGLFKYNNMDHSIEMGLALAKNLLTGEERDHRLIASEDKYFG